MFILGIDYGDKKIGLAFGDTETRVSVPMNVLINTGEKTLEILAKRIKQEAIGLVVVGVPFLHGKEHSSDQIEKTRVFIKRIREKVSVPIVEEDESYTTFESIRLQKQEGALAKEDALAAMLLVRQFLEK